MPNAVETLISEYASVVSLPVLWGDMDALRHVNNIASIRWFESSRIRLVEHREISSILKAQNLAMILASVSCNYRRQLRYPDTVHIGSKVTRLGNTSLTMEHAVVSEQLDSIASDGTSVVVCFDYETQRPVRIPDELREATDRFVEP